MSPSTNSEPVTIGCAIAVVLIGLGVTADCLALAAYLLGYGR